MAPTTLTANCVAALGHTMGWVWVQQSIKNIPAGASITFLCSAFYLVGRALDEVVNPRLRRQDG